jgi:hypothetical protein
MTDPDSAHKGSNFVSPKVEGIANWWAEEMGKKDEEPTESSLTKEEARQLTNQIRAGLGLIWGLIVQAYEERADVALGYESWDLYCHVEFDAYHLRVPRDDRKEVVKSMRAAGMNYREIESATGMSKDTAQRAMKPKPVSNETSGKGGNKATGRAGVTNTRTFPTEMVCAADVKDTSHTSKRWQQGVVTRFFASREMAKKYAERQTGCDVKIIDIELVKEA